MNSWLAPDVTVHALGPALTAAGGVGREAATVFAGGTGLTMEEWLERRFGNSLIDADDVGAAVLELTTTPGGGTWFVGAGGLEEWNGILSSPVKA
jgi:hypothetical protein